MTDRTNHQLLVVEDDDELRDSVATLLELRGYEVATAANGNEALRHLKAGLRPCAILLDLMMPVMNGWDFRACQLADPALRDVPVIVMSGVTAHLDASFGATAKVAKPFRFERLVEVVRETCPGDP